MEALQNFLEWLGGYVWGAPLLILLGGTAIYLSFRLLFLQVHMLPMALKQAFSPPKEHEKDHEGDISHFGALMTALSATIGTGNIAGVATAIVSGGPGAVFWMWITAFFGMATKYGEAVLAVKYRITNDKGEMSGGPMYYIERGLGIKWLAVLFALFGVLASFGIGSSVQANSVAQAIQASFHVDPWITGAALTVLTAVVVLGGIQSISKATSFIVPFMAIVYVVGGLAIIFLHYDKVIPAVELICRSAFGLDAVVGGAMGTAIRYGVARGVFSNESGMGSAPIAAAAAKTDHPCRQALVSMTGTFLDTLVVCSITGIVLVIGGLYATSGDTGAALTSHTFNDLLPGPGGWLVTFGLVFFAYSTILGWCYYGEKCASYLGGEKVVPIYRIVYVVTVLLGAGVNLGLVWAAADVFNGLMAVPNLIALLLLSNVIVSETRDFIQKRRSGELH